MQGGWRFIRLSLRDYEEIVTRASKVHDGKTTHSHIAGLFHPPRHRKMTP